MDLNAVTNHLRQLRLITQYADFAKICLFRSTNTLSPNTHHFASSMNDFFRWRDCERIFKVLTRTECHLFSRIFTNSVLHPFWDRQEESLQNYCEDWYPSATDKPTCLRFFSRFPGELPDPKRIAIITCILCIVHFYYFAAPLLLSTFAQCASHSPAPIGDSRCVTVASDAGRIAAAFIFPTQKKKISREKSIQYSWTMA